jgi:hypothetical protein
MPVMPVMDRGRSLGEVPWLGPGCAGGTWGTFGTGWGGPGSAAAAFRFPMAIGSKALGAGKTNARSKIRGTVKTLFIPVSLDFCRAFDSRRLPRQALLS